jgi:hypothetical protein
LVVLWLISWEGAASLATCPVGRLLGNPYSSPHPYPSPDDEQQDGKELHHAVPGPVLHHGVGGGKHLRACGRAAQKWDSRARRTEPRWAARCKPDKLHWSSKQVRLCVGEAGHKHISQQGGGG